MPVLDKLVKALPLVHVASLVALCVYCIYLVALLIHMLVTGARFVDSQAYINFVTTVVTSLTVLVAVAITSHVLRRILAQSGRT